MKIRKLKRIFAVVLSVSLCMSVITGCGSSKNGGGASSSSKQVLTYNLNADPATLDPALNNAVDGAIVIVNLFEGLYKLDENNKAIPGVAEDVKISDDGKTYTFKLKDGLKWSNGDPITAKDFEYAWKRVIDPTVAAEYAYQMSYIKNADEVNQNKDIDGDGKIASMDDVGVKAVDDTTLEVNLTEPCSYFLELTAFPCYFPVDKSVVENNATWANDAKTYVSNGPFKMSEYAIKDKIVLEKNENYYNASNVKLDKLDIKLVRDETSAWASYKSGQFDMVDVVPQSEIQEALKDGSATAFEQLGTYFYCINLSDKAKDVNPDAAKALSDVKVRKALSLALDRKSIVDNVAKGGQIPAFSLVPEGIKDEDGNDFTQKEYFKPEGDLDEAKKLLAEAGYPNGEGFPTIVLTFNPESGHGTIAQAVQDMWKTNLGINVELQSQEWKVFQNTRNNKDYEIARHGWVGDYVDPMTFLDMWLSTSGQNNAGYNNPKYDELVKAAKSETDTVKRTELMHQAEDIIIEDMPIIPIYYYTQPKGIKDYVKGVNVSPLGFIYFDQAYIDGK